MRDVLLDRIVWDKISDLRTFLAVELKMSEEAAMSRMDRMGVFLVSLGAPVDYPPCRFKKWRMLHYHCAVFEKDWVFAYEVVPEGVIVRDMSNASLLIE